MNVKVDTDLGNQEIFTANLNRYVAASGKTQKEIAKAIGISAGTFNDWMKARAYPRMDKIQKLAEYFDVSMSDIVNKPKKKEDEKFEAQKKELLKLLEEVPEEKRDAMIALLRFAKDNH